MKILIQRVLHASVQICEETVGAIGAGALVFVGVTHGDTSKQVNWLVNKLVNLRIFEDSEGKMNKSLLDQKGEALIISQFTLYGDCSSGRRPSFSSAANPDLAQQLYEQFIAEVKAAGVTVQTGLFGAEMKVSLLNDGPVTFMIESL